MNLFKILCISLSFPCTTSWALSGPSLEKPAFIQIQGTQFIQSNKPYRFLSANFWSAANLAQLDGGKEKLKTELDELKKVGVRHLRIMALSEGGPNSPWQVQPTFQPEFGIWDSSLLAALDYVIAEAAKRDLTLTLVLGNFWPWSGGFAQYVHHYGGGEIPYPPPAVKGDWKIFQDYVGTFYKNKEAIAAYHRAVKKIVTRKNSVSGVYYKNDPTVFSWQLANEPRGNLDRSGFLKWIESSASLIHSLDPNHLVSLGSEGNTPYGITIGNHFEEDHTVPGIDYATAHVWAENWGWYDPKNTEKTWTKTLNQMQQYIRTHAELSQKINRPLVIEEFGLARDQRSYSPDSKTAKRDFYYNAVFKEVLNSIRSDGSIQGVGFWAWSGHEKPQKPYGGIWKKGAPLLGDPPHEHQGWYGVYSSDNSTLEVLKDFSKKLFQ